MLKIDTGSSAEQAGYIKKELPKSFITVGTILLVVGVVLGIISYIVEPTRAAYSYLTTFLFVVSIGIGSLFLVALEYASGAVWSVPFRRVSEFFSSIVPFLILLAIPLVFNLHDIFKWSQPAAVSSEKILQGKAPYLNVPFFIIRNAVIFIFWTFFYLLIIKNSRKQDSTGEQLLTKRNITTSTIFIPFYAFTISILAIDWMMSIEPTWFSTIFGVYFFAGITMCALAVATLAVLYLLENDYLGNRISDDNVYSLGTLMFAFTAFWGYIAFSQYMLIWYGDLPEETSWFFHRWDGGWKYASIILVITHFIVPFFGLLSSKAKVNHKRLKFMSIWLIANHLFDIYWMVMPGMVVTGHTYFFSWSDLVFPVAAAGLFILLFAIMVKKHNLMPLGDPKLKRGLEFRL